MGGAMAFKVISHSAVTAAVVEDKIEDALNSPKPNSPKLSVALAAEDEEAWTKVMTNKIVKGKAKRCKKKGKKSRRAKKEKVKPSAESLARFGISDYKSQNKYGVDRKKKSKKNSPKWTGLL